MTIEAMSRRGFLGAGLAGLGLAGLGGYALTHDTTSQLSLVEQRVELPRLPKAFEGYRIGFFTDPHLGVYVPTEWVDEAISLLSKARIDVLLMGGDYIWFPDNKGVEHLYPVRNPRFAHTDKPTAMVSEIFSVVADLAAKLDPPDGKFAVLGNHDGWTGPHLCKQEFTKRQIQVLENDVHSISRGSELLHIYGSADYWTGIPKPPPFSGLAAGNEARILLTHNPDYTSELVRLNFQGIDLAISGHTHGGQVKLPLVGALHANVEDMRFREGFFRAGGLISYTSRGVGVVEMPIRLNCPPEVTVFELIGA